MPALSQAAISLVVKACLVLSFLTIS